MTYAIQKSYKNYSSRELYNFEYAFEAYYYDRFYRYLATVPFDKLIESVSAGDDNSSGSIYLNARLFSPKARNLDSVRQIQMLSFYIRPEDYPSSAMKRIKLDPYVLFAGYTNNGGMRWGVPVSINVPGFASLPPVKRSNIYANAYKKGLSYYRSEYAILGIKPTAELMECLYPLQPEEFYDNTENYKILQL